MHSMRGPDQDSEDFYQKLWWVKYCNETGDDDSDGDDGDDGISYNGDQGMWWER